jgi:hypothetical protein
MIFATNAIPVVQKTAVLPVVPDALVLAMIRVVKIVNAKNPTTAPVPMDTIARSVIQFVAETNATVKRV